MPDRRARIPLLSCYRDEVWQQVRIADGTDLLSFWPLESGHFFACHDFERADGDADALYRRLQLRKHPYFGAKPAVAVLRVAARGLDAEAAVRRSNLRFGSGGATLLRLPDADRLELVEVVPLSGGGNERRRVPELAPVAVTFEVETASLTFPNGGQITPRSVPADVVRSVESVPIDGNSVFTQVDIAGLGPARITFSSRAGRLATASIMADPGAERWRHWTHEAGARHVDAHARALLDWIGSGAPPPDGSIGLFRDPHNHCGSIEIDYLHSCGRPRS